MAEPLKVKFVDGQWFLVLPDGTDVPWKPKLEGPTYSDYIEDVVTPTLFEGKPLARRARHKLARAKLVITQRPLDESVAAELEAGFLARRSAKPQMPPPAIRHMTTQGPVYELVDEQHSGLGYYRAHGQLTVYVVETVTHDY